MGKQWKQCQTLFFWAPKSLDYEEGWAPKNWYFWTVVLEKTLESPLDWKEIQPFHSKGDQPWDFFGRNDAKAETPVLWPPHVKSWLWRRVWWWEGLGAGEEGDNRGWDGWMASLTRWMWVWVNSRSWWWTESPGMLRFMGSQRVGHDWVTELNWTEVISASEAIIPIASVLKWHMLGSWACKYSGARDLLNLYSMDIQGPSTANGTQ